MFVIREATKEERVAEFFRRVKEAANQCGISDGMIGVIGADLKSAEPYVDQWGQVATCGMISCFVAQRARKLTGCKVDPTETAVAPRPRVVR